MGNIKYVVPTSMIIHVNLISLLPLVHHYISIAMLRLISRTHSCIIITTARCQGDTIGLVNVNIAYYVILYIQRGKNSMNGIYYLYFVIIDDRWEGNDLARLINKHNEHVQNIMCMDTHLMCTRTSY